MYVVTILRESANYLLIHRLLRLRPTIWKSVLLYAYQSICHCLFYKKTIGTPQTKTIFLMVWYVCPWRLTLPRCVRLTLIRCRWYRWWGKVWSGRYRPFSADRTKIGRMPLSGAHTCWPCCGGWTVSRIFPGYWSFVFWVRWSVWASWYLSVFWPFI